MWNQIPLYSRKKLEAVIAYVGSRWTLLQDENISRAGDKGLEQLHVSDYQGDGPSVQIPLSYKPTQNTDFVRQAHCTLLLTQGSPGLPTGRSQRKDVSGLLETEGDAKEC